jgi:hypothetical protein
MLRATSNPKDKHLPVRKSKQYLQNANISKSLNVILMNKAFPCQGLLQELAVPYTTTSQRLNLVKANHS